MGAAIREAHEEVGVHLALGRQAIAPRALALDVGPDQVTPYAVLEARVPLTFDQVAAGHFAAVSRHEGAFEIGGEMLGIPFAREVLPGVVAWLRLNSHRFTRSGLSTTLITLGHVMSPEELLAAWAKPQEPWVPVVGADIAAV